jgi:1,4-dihydroxy-2-naphthoyl-CoA synthase
MLHGLVLLRGNRASADQKYHYQKNQDLDAVHTKIIPESRARPKAIFWRVPGWPIGGVGVVRTVRGSGWVLAGEAVA